MATSEADRVSDEKLAERWVSERDGQSSSTLVRRHRGRLEAYFWAAGLENDAADLADEALVLALLRYNETHRERFRTLLFIEAHHLCVDEYRRRGRRVKVTLLIDDGRDADILSDRRSSPGHLERDRLHLKRCLDALALPERLAVCLWLGTDGRISVAEQIDGLESDLAAPNILNRGRAAVAECLGHVSEPPRRIEGDRAGQF